MCYLKVLATDLLLRAQFPVLLRRQQQRQQQQNCSNTAPSHTKVTDVSHCPIAVVKYQAEQLREEVLLDVELGDSETLGTRMAQQ